MNTKRFLKLTICLLLFSGFVGYGQEESSNKFVSTLDFGGNGGGYSLNGEFELITKESYLLNTRLGFGYLPVENTQFLAIPFGFNILTGKGKHHIEGGLGLSYIQGLTFKNVMIDNSEKYYSDEALYFVPTVGYRFDKLTKGLTFKVYYSPLMVIHDFFDEDKFIDEVTKDVIVFGETTKRDWFDYFYGDEFLPKAINHFGYFGISIGYRF